MILTIWQIYNLLFMIFFYSMIYSKKKQVDILYVIGTAMINVIIGGLYFLWDALLMNNE
jgi:hypothetical protein